MSASGDLKKIYNKAKKKKNKPKIKLNNKGLLSAAAERQKKLDKMLKEIERKKK